MELKLANGDYIPSIESGTCFETVTAMDEILQRVLFKLTVHRGSFPFVPELGSDLWLLYREKKSNRVSAAYQFVAQALQDEKMISIDDVFVNETFDGIEVDVKLMYEGESASLTIEI